MANIKAATLGIPSQRKRHIKETEDTKNQISIWLRRMNAKEYLNPFHEAKDLETLREITFEAISDMQTAIRYCLLRLDEI